MRLTNKRLTFGASGKTILLVDIENVEIETRTADATRIKIRLGRETEYIAFARHTPGHIVHILIGDSGLSHSEVSSYTAYWASLLTMATFMFGRKSKIEEVVLARKAWCWYCKDYIEIPSTDDPVWKVKCPKCGHKEMTTLSLEDRKRPKGFGRTI